MARDTPIPIQFSQYIAARLAASAITTFEVDSNLRVARFLGRLMHRFDKRHRQRASKHIAIAFPDKSDEQVAALTKASFEHFVQLLVEILHTPQTLHREAWPHRTEPADMADAIAYMNSGKPAIMLTGHVGNWEVLGYLMALMGYSCDAIARPLDNVFLNDWIVRVRERHGVRIIMKWDATERMVGVLQSGGALGFIADQNAGDKGLFVPFFGKLASTYKSIALLAINQNVPIICGCAGRIGGKYRYHLFTTDIVHPHEWADQDDPVFYVTARYIRAIEQMVLRHPEQYLWMHRRWKSRPKFEREGKPMPASLREKLEKLPWMDQPTMNRLLEPMPA